jgi:hypothetical protein
MNMDAGDPRLEISAEDAAIIQMHQVMTHYHCLDINVYRNNPAWWNKAAYALIRTESRAAQDKYQDKK